MESYWDYLPHFKTGPMPRSSQSTQNELNGISYRLLSLIVCRGMLCLIGVLLTYLYI